MNTIIPRLFPTSGLRTLTGKEMLQRAKSLNCTLPIHSKPTCSSQMNVGIFFDGTGNNRTADFLAPIPANRKHSNIVKLFHCFPDDRANGYFSFYIPGVGTPFPDIDDNGLLTSLGGPFAWNGENRVILGFIRLLNSVNNFVTGINLLDNSSASLTTRLIGSIGMPPGFRRSMFKGMQKQLRENLKGKRPEIELINLSVFGFSRGAAEARAFANWLFETCEQKDGGWLFAGIPIRLGFLGIFDTVASVGIPNSLPQLFAEGHQSWADGNMHINPNIEQCIHFVAGHEVRASFPLDSVRAGDKFPPNTKEVMYPGAHSDLGGGYAPNDLGISPSGDDILAKIPAMQMYHEARTAGVPLVHWAGLSNSDRADLTPSAKVISAFNSYLRSAKVMPGPIDELHRRHMIFYLSYRYKFRNNLFGLPFYLRASKKHQRYIAMTSSTINERLRNLHVYHFDPSKPHTDEAHYKKNPTGYYIDPSDNRYSLKESVAARKKMITRAGSSGSEHLASSQLLDILSMIDPHQLTPDIENFFGNFIHDSMAGFIEMSPRFTDEYRLNGQGILRFRTIFKEDG